LDTNTAKKLDVGKSRTGKPATSVAGFFFNRVIGNRAGDFNYYRYPNLMYYLAEPKQFIKATKTKFELVYFLFDGDRSGTFVLASGVRSANGMEETALFLCDDAYGTNVVYEPITTIPMIDDEGALNSIGYTARLAKWKNNPNNLADK